MLDHTMPRGVQAFNWLSHQGDYYGHICDMAPTFKRLGFTYVWLPPPTASVSPEGYMPTDYFNLSSRYGDEAGLRRAVAALKAEGIKVAGDCVLNHRCALHQDENGIWNKVRAGFPTCRGAWGGVVWAAALRCRFAAPGLRGPCCEARTTRTMLVRL